MLELVDDGVNATLGGRVSLGEADLGPGQQLEGEGDVIEKEALQPLLPG